MATQEYIRTLKTGLIALVTLVALVIAPASRPTSFLVFDANPVSESSTGSPTSDDDGQQEESFLMAHVQIAHTVSFSLPIIKAICPLYSGIELPVFTLLGETLPKAVPFLRYFKVVALFFAAPNAP